MIERIFAIHSLEKLNTVNQDLDVGVVRVSACLLRCLGGRGSLVKITPFEPTENTRSIVRIIRAATGENALTKDQIALQYDDRLALGVKKVGACHKLKLKPVHNWLSLPKFLLGHPSPLVRKEAIFGIALMISGVVLGVVLGAGLGFFVGLRS